MLPRFYGQMPGYYVYEGGLGGKAQLMYLTQCIPPSTRPKHLLALKPTGPEPSSGPSAGA